MHKRYQLYVYIFHKKDCTKSQENLQLYPLTETGTCTLTLGCDEQFL